MPFLDFSTSILVLIFFSISMILVTWFFTRHKGLTNEYFLVSNRNIHWLIGAGSLAASWIWAPALFVSSQQAYQLGLPGIFWFVFPNVIAVAIYFWLAPRIREKFPQGHTLPEYIGEKLGDKKVHKIYFFGYSFYQLMAVAVQLFAGSSLIFLLTGIPLELSIFLLALTVFVYAWISGFESSVVTDFVQLCVIFLGLIIVVPAVLNAAGGFEIVAKGIGGITGEHTNIFDPAVAFSFGIVTAIGLISGAIADQQFWQRAFAFNKKSIKLGFIAGAILFGIVPITLSLLGFIAASPTSGIILPQGVDSSMIGVLTVAHYLSPLFIIVFFLMLLAGLASTLDSALSAFSALYAVDMHKFSKSKDLTKPRTGMLLILILGILVALITAYIPGFGLKQLWWIFNAVAATMVVPTLLSLYWNKLTAKGAYYGIIAALVIGLPIFVYGNFIDNTMLIVMSALFIILINAVICWLFRKKTAKISLA
jgi:Na+/proline symporter